MKSEDGNNTSCQSESIAVTNLGFLRNLYPSLYINSDSVIALSGTTGIVGKEPSAMSRRQGSQPGAVDFASRFTPVDGWKALRSSRFLDEQHICTLTLNIQSS